MTTVYGLTGSIGMGKSVAAALFRSLGVPVFDSDAHVHRLTAPGGAAVPHIAAAFPGCVDQKTGQLDRAALGRAVFADPVRRETLESILHPLVFEAMEQFRLWAVRNGIRAIVLDIPLLFETGADRVVDHVICVRAPAFLQKQRVLKRPGMTPERFDAILATQMGEEEKRRRADFCIETGLGRAAVHRRIREILRQTG